MVSEEGTPVQRAKRRVDIVPHTHWDREWYSPFQTFRLRLVDLLDSLLPQLESDPSYAHFLLDGPARCWPEPTRRRGPECLLWSAAVLSPAESRARSWWHPPRSWSTRRWLGRLRRHPAAARRSAGQDHSDRGDDADRPRVVDGGSSGRFTADRVAWASHHGDPPCGQVRAIVDGSPGECAGNWLTAEAFEEAQWSTVIPQPHG